MVTLIRKARPLGFKCLCLQLGLQKKMGREGGGKDYYIVKQQTFPDRWERLGVDLIYHHVGFIDQKRKRDQVHFIGLLCIGAGTSGSRRPLWGY